MAPDQASTAATVPAALSSSAVETLKCSEEKGAASHLHTDNYKVGLNEDLLEALSSIQTPGSFASFSVLPRPPPAGLFVDDVGDISLPLSESQARQLISKACQAPFGKGSATIIDTAVRNTWELDPEQFTFRNPEWPGFVQDLCARVALDLGINAPITAEIYKMLIYEKGAMFKAHTDTEKIPGMFGTLIVCLPSTHQGGELVLKHCGEKKVFKTSDISQSFASWYSDVSHEVLPVTSGFRWVLTYNLALDLTGPGPSAGLQHFETAAIRRTLKRWLSDAKQSRETNSVYHVLDHDYTEANISFKALKTRDLAQVQVLKEISTELAFDVFLALLEKKEQGSCEPHGWDPRFDSYKSRRNYNDDDEAGYHSLDDVFERRYTVKTLVDLEGHVVTQGLRLDEDDILQEHCFQSLEAEEEYEGYMGNSGPTATHWYRVTAVVIVPRDSLMSFFNSYDEHSYHLQDETFKTQIRYFARVCLQPQAPESSVHALVNMCEHAWARGHKKVNGIGSQERWTDGDGIWDVLKAAMQHRIYRFFEEAAGRHHGLLPLNFFAWMRQWLNTGDGGTNERFNAIRKGISSAISSYPYFDDQFRAITNLVPIPNKASTPDTTATPDCLLDWARGQLRSCIDACASKSLGGKDGPAMVDLALYFDDPSAFITQIVTPLVDQKHHAAAFFIAFLARLRQQSTKGILQMENATEFYLTKARSFITLANFIQMHGHTKDIEATLTPRQFYNCEKVQSLDSRTIVSYKVLAYFFSVIVQLSTEADDLVKLFVSKLVANARQLPVVEFPALWLPFLRWSIPIFIANSIPLDTPYCQQLYSTLLRTYIDRYVGRKPAEDRNLARRGVPCTCSDCSSLNAFLVSPTQTVGCFAVNKQRRAHLHQQLDSARVDCTHETHRSGSPQTLVVTKTFSQNKKMRVEWELRLAKAKAQIAQFKDNELELLLGSSYPTIVNMAHLSAAEPAQDPSRPVGSASRSTTNQPHRPLQAIGSAGASRSSVAGVKRKLPGPETEIIDLTQ